MQQKNILVTGGAGFIGSNIAKTLLKDERVAKVRVLDNLATGYIENINSLIEDEKFEFYEYDIRDFEACKEAVKGIDLVCHQAALGSVPRSIKDPLTTNAVNITGFLNILIAAKDEGIKRFVYASSSSVYGSDKTMPKLESITGQVLSPYAVTKLVNEQYAKVFADIYKIQTIGLRYFNIFGSNQSPQGAYAAVIPLFIKALKENNAPVINGDGSISRDFTHVSNAVNANILALFSDNEAAYNQVYNIACGEKTSLLQLFDMLRQSANSTLQPIFGPERLGDIQHSLADITKARTLLGYEPQTRIQEGIDETFNNFKF